MKSSAMKEQAMQGLVAKLDSAGQQVATLKHQPKGDRVYFDVGIGSVCLAGADTGGAYCLLEMGLAPGMGVPRHTGLAMHGPAARLLNRQSMQAKVVDTVTVPHIADLIGNTGTFAY
jgi:hypothetical protein